MTANNTPMMFVRELANGKLSSCHYLGVIPRGMGLRSQRSNADFHVVLITETGRLTITTLENFQKQWRYEWSFFKERAKTKLGMIPPANKLV